MTEANLAELYEALTLTTDPVKRAGLKLRIKTAEGPPTVNDLDRGTGAMSGLFASPPPSSGPLDLATDPPEGRWTTVRVIPATRVLGIRPR